jgi:RecJ-like exonuclease
MRHAAIVLAIASLLLAAPASAWKESMASGVRPIAEVQEKAESGDYVMVEGRVTHVATGSGSRYVVTLEDDTGSVLVRVPEHMLRKLNDGKPPEVGRQVRVGGKWDHASLDDAVWGIHAQTAERVE